MPTSAQQGEARASSAIHAAEAENSRTIEGVISVRDRRYGAKGDGTTDDTAALQAAIADAKAHHLAVYLPPGRYRFHATLDVTGLDVSGAGRTTSVLALDEGVQVDAVVTQGNTALRYLGIFGGWDGRTPGQHGSGFVTLSDPAAKPPYYGYDVRLDDLSIQYTKENCITIHQGSYESLHNVKCNASGQNSLYMDSGHNAGFETTSTNIDGLCTFSNTYGYGAFIHDAATVSFSGITTMEETQGIRLAGINGRSLRISGLHQEDTRGGKFITAADSSGIGLTLTDNFFAGKPVLPEAPNEFDHWFNIVAEGNSFSGGYSTASSSVVKGFDTPDADPVEIVTGGWRFSPAQPTAIGLLQHTTTAAWSARLVGSWVTGDSTPKVAHEFLLTSAHPTVAVGSATWRFGLGKDGRFAATVTSAGSPAGPYEFQGVIELVVDRQHSATGDIAVQTDAIVSVGIARVSGLAGHGTAQVCAREDGTLYRCGK